MASDIISSIIIFFSENIVLFQFISLFISGILLAFVIYYLVKLNLVGERLEHYIDVLGSKNISKRRTLRAWKQIRKRLKTKNESQFKLAILEADRILNEILKMAGYKGKDLDEILKQITPAQLSNINEIWQVHKLRNRISSEPDFLISLNEAEIVIDIYKKAFQELNLIS